ncbi:ubiquitin-conjugating enzyme/RWD-like protein [Kockovaella imperatae]|uniref:E2 ubiquitin-conjugating enzyme n=1 Tax=Kockovaella imperatae TaxID=4999 RepID=A0A1Y1UQ71_9TREE|nr:ubiquitin-conjugating enzyme/RWD-like protein [Kockovaella imperatae]ORX40122.1 ubiquitin-conjugating enzyme/RWD-like protein [Kockovaella imperatae]
MNEPLENIEIQPDEDNVQLWRVIFHGPKHTPYAGGKFVLAVEFTLEYPFKPPMAKFRTKMYHPNVDSEGSLCLGILKSDQWKPSTKMSHVLVSIYDLLVTPNPDDPLVTSIADQYRTDRKGFEKKAAEYTSKFAT